MSKEQNIIFHHIPKCGGTSIVMGLAMTYYPWQLLTRGRKGFAGNLNAPASSKEAEKKGINRYQYRRQLLAERVNQGHYPMISGHYPFNPDLYELKKDQWHFVSLLRDPLERWYSEYYWNRYKDHEYRKTNLSIEEYLESDHGLENTRSFINFFSTSLNNSDPVTEAEKNEALNNIIKLDVVGCLEKLDQFQSAMKHKFGRKPFFLKTNKSPAPLDIEERPDTDSAFHKKLTSLLEADQEIYRKVTENI